MPPRTSAPSTSSRLASRPSSAPAPVDPGNRTRDHLVAPPSLSLPKGGGAIQGIGEKFQANAVTGTASLSVPIATPGARGGFGPGLALSYDSGAGNGPFGVGWQLAVGAIQRKTDHGLPRYRDGEDSDTFVLSGAEDLVPWRDESGGSWSDRTGAATEDGVTYTTRWYRPRVEGAFTRIERWTDASGDAHWRTWTRDNVRRIYGQDPSARLADPSDATRVFAWYLEEEYHELGERVRYIYKAEDRNGAADSAAEALRGRSGHGCAYTYLKRVLYGYVAPVSAEADPGWLFEVVLDYGEHDATAPARDDDDTSDWTRREDVFSRYRAGFDVRCYRLCARVLLFHRLSDGAEASARLVRSTDLSYSPSPVATTLDSVTVRGWRWNGAAYDHAELPALTFAYSAATLGSEVRFLDGLDDLPAGVDIRRFQWVDLDGEGLSGLLGESGGALFYKRNEGGGALAALQRLPARPAVSVSAGQLRDVDGDGRLELLHLSPAIQGYQPRDPDGGWGALRRFQNLPVLDWNDPDLRMIDLDGDGLPDLLITGQDALVWFPSEGADGYGERQRIWRGDSEAEEPICLFSAKAEAIFLADMSGDGLVDLVRVRNGSICYWPNLGYGRFGGLVQMGGAPCFDAPDRFDSGRVRLADLDGAGPADLIYLGADRARVWWNQCGNDWSDEQILDHFPGLASPAGVVVADLLGDGTACLVWSSNLGRDGWAPLRYLSLMSEGKPYLLTRVRNGLGRDTRYTYLPSTSYYLADRRAGRPWATRLPFPVQCLSEVEVRDHVTGWRFVTTYAYHHGFYDGVEREFRGFGKVEQWDTESFADFEDPDVANSAMVTHVDPVRTVTWFHTGALREEATLEAAFETEYYASDTAALALEPNRYEDSDLSTAELREAVRALKGRPLRQEVYTEGGEPYGPHPYTVSTTRYALRRLQPANGAAPAVFMAYEQETLSSHYERDASDPRVQHTLTLAVDDYGTVTTSAAVAYPRRGSGLDAAQATGVVVITETTVIHDDDAANQRWHLGLPARGKTSHLDGYTVSASAAVTIDDLLADLATLPSGVTKRLLQYELTTYASFDGAGAMSELGVESFDALAIVYQKYLRAFDDALISTVHGSDVSDADLEDAGYVERTGGTDADEAGWYVPSGTRTLDASRFYIALSVTDPFGSSVELEWHESLLFVSAILDAVGNQVSALYDTDALLPTQLTDPNGNLSYAAFDALARLTEVRVVGKDDEGDPSATVLEPTSSFSYELSRWNDAGLPARVYSKQRETHADGGTRWLERYSYSDGGGNLVQEKVSAEPGTAPERVDGELVFVSGELSWAEADPRWVGTGRAVVNNKGNPVRQYEPFFSATEEYEWEEQVVEWGVSPLVSYDPLGRVIRVDNPDGTLRRVEFSPWKQRYYDENDTVLDSAWHSAHSGERADTLAQDHADTPTSVHLDALGRAYATDEILDGSTTYTTPLTLDVEGNPTVVTDARSNAASTQTFDRLGRVLKVVSADAGIDRTLHDVGGRPCKVWRSGSLVLTYAYDALRRRTRLWVTEGSADPRLVERNLYGEALADPAALNHRTRLYRQYDTAGVVTFEAYDFKGNLLSSNRRFWADPDTDVDWTALDAASDPEDPDDVADAAESALEEESFCITQTWDALNRLMTRTTPDESVTTLSYNEAGLPETVSANLRGAGTPTPFVTGISYNARGQRDTVVYANEVQTICTYDDLTYRLRHLVSTRPGTSGTETLQDLSYTYDPAGNIVSVLDAAQDTLYMNNTEIRPEQLFEYDALYRLTYAKGRELREIGATSDQDPTLGGIPAGTGPITQVYEERYQYDPVGNITQLAHGVADPTGQSWTRDYIYATASNQLLETEIGTTTLSYGYDDRGSMTEMPHLVSIRRDFRDQIAAAELNTSGDDAIYLYDASGRRVRKIVRRGQNTEIRSYLGGYEVYRKYASSDLTVQRQTLHLNDGQRRVALVETLTEHPTLSTPTTVQRYQLDNHLGTATVEVNEAAEIISYEEYHPYGTTAWRAADGDTEVSQKRYRYTGKEKDEETGLYYHGARHYAPWLARWTSVDPEGLADGINALAYVKGGPVQASDPTGRFKITAGDVVGFGVSVLVGLAIVGIVVGAGLATGGIGSAILIGALAGATGAASGELAREVVDQEDISLAKIGTAGVFGGITGGVLGGGGGAVSRVLSSGPGRQLATTFLESELGSTVSNAAYKAAEHPIGQGLAAVSRGLRTHVQEPMERLGQKIADKIGGKMAERAAARAAEREAENAVLESVGNKVRGEKGGAGGKTWGAARATGPKGSFDGTTRSGENVRGKGGIQEGDTLSAPSAVKPGTLTPRTRPGYHPNTFHAEFKLMNTVFVRTGGGQGVTAYVAASRTFCPGCVQAAFQFESMAPGSTINLVSGGMSLQSYLGGVGAGGGYMMAPLPPPTESTGAPLLQLQIDF